MIKALLISFIVGANALAAQNTTSSNKLSHPQGTWSCGCEGTFDVCSVSTCYYSSNCGYGESRKEWPNKANKQTLALTLAKTVKQNVGDHQCVSKNQPIDQPVSIIHPHVPESLPTRPLRLSRRGLRL